MNLHFYLPRKKEETETFFKYEIELVDQIKFDFVVFCKNQILRKIIHASKNWI